MTDILKKFDLSGKFDGLLNEGIFEDSEVPGTGKEEPEFGNHYSEDDQFYGTADVDGSGAYDETDPKYGNEKDNDIIKKILKEPKKSMAILINSVSSDYEEMHGMLPSVETITMIKKTLLKVARKMLLVQAKGEKALGIDYKNAKIKGTDDEKKYNSLLKGAIQSASQYYDHFNLDEKDYELYLYPNFRYKEDTEEAQRTNTFYEPKYIAYLKLNNRYNVIDDFKNDPRISIHQNDMSADFVDALNNIDDIRQYNPNDFNEAKYGVSSKNMFGAKTNIFFLNTDNNFTIFSSTARSLNLFKKAIEAKAANNISADNYNIIDVEFKGEPLTELSPEETFFEIKENGRNNIIKEGTNGKEVELEPGTFLVNGDGIFKKLRKTKDVTNEDENPFVKMISVIIRYAAISYNIEIDEEKLDDYASFNYKKSNTFYRNMNMAPIWTVPTNLQYGLYEMWSRAAEKWGHVMPNGFDNSYVFISSFGYSVKMSKQELQTYKNFRSILLSGQYPELTEQFISFKKMILGNGYLPYFAGRVPDDQINDIVASTMFIDGKPDIFKRKTYVSLKGNKSTEHKPVFNTFGNDTIFAAKIDKKTKNVIYYKRENAPAEYATSTLSVDHIDGNHNNNFYQNLRLATSSFNTDWSNQYGSIVFTMTPTDICLSNPEYVKTKISWSFEWNKRDEILMPVGIIGDPNNPIKLTSSNLYEGLYTPSIYGRLGAISGANDLTANTTMGETVTIATPVMDIKNNKERIFFLDISEILGKGYQKQVRGEEEFSELSPEDIRLAQNTLTGKETPMSYSNNMGISVLNKIIKDKYSNYQKWFNIQASKLHDDDEFTRAYNINYNPEQADGQQEQPIYSQQNQNNSQNQEAEKKFQDQNTQVTEATKKKKDNEPKEANTLVSRFVKFGQKITLNAMDTLRFIKNIIIENTTDENIVRANVGNDVFIEIGIRKRNDFIKELESDLSNWKGNYFVSRATGQRDNSQNPIWYGIYPRSSSAELPAISVTGKFGMVHMTQDGPKVKMDKTGAYSTVYPTKVLNKEELMFLRNSNESFGDIINKVKNMTPRKAPLKNKSDISPASISLHIFSASSWKLGVFKRQIEYLKDSETYGNTESGINEHSPLIVHHINGIQSDFRPENLTWITPENNTAFDSGVAIGLYRITPGTGEEVPIRVWFTKKIYDEDRTRIYDNDLPGGPYEIKKIRLTDKVLDSARTHKEFIGGTEYTYVYRRVLVKDTDREFPYMRGSNEEELLKKKLASIVAVEYEGPKSSEDDEVTISYRSTDHFEYVVPDKLDVSNPNMVMYHYIRGRVNPNNENNAEAINLVHDIIKNVMLRTGKYDNLSQVKCLENIVFGKGLISDETIKNGDAIKEALSAKAILLRGFCVADNIEPEYQKFIWNLDENSNFKYISDPNMAERVKSELKEMITSSKVDPDCIPLCLLSECMKSVYVGKDGIDFKHKRGTKAANEPESEVQSMKRFNLGIKQYRSRLRQDYVNASKFYSDDENPYDKAVKRLEEKRTRKKNKELM